MDDAGVNAMVRRAVPADRQKVVETVTAAFVGDSAWAFLLGDEYERMAPLFAGALFDLRIGSGNVWVAADALAVAMWESPGRGERSSSHSDGIWSRYSAAIGARATGRLAVYNDAVARASPQVPHWYLGVLATHPSHQREGLASSVLAPVLADADASATACGLETSTKPNRRFYEHRGFTNATDLILPGGPPTWWLTRYPQATQPGGAMKV